MGQEVVSILIVDDEPDMGWTLENILKIKGYSTQVVTSGTEAIELLRQRPFKLVFIDARLPDIDGLELSRLIKKKYPEVSLVLISGYFYSDDSVIKEALIEGLYAGFIGKPFEMEEVYKAAGNALGR